MTSMELGDIIDYRNASCSTETNINKEQYLSKQMVECITYPDWTKQRIYGKGWENEGE